MSTQSMPKERTYESPSFEISTDGPIRVPDPRTMKMQDLKGILDEINALSVEEMLVIREKTYEVMDRMDEILLDGGRISPEQIDEIICGITMLEELLLNKMKGLPSDEIKSTLKL